MSMCVFGVQQRSGKEQMRADFVFVDNQEDNIVYEKAWRYVYTAVELWGLIDSQHSKDMLRFMKEQVEANMDDEGEYILTPAEVKRLVSLMQGLDTAILQITDKHWRLRPEHVASVMQQQPDLVTRWKQEDGTMVYSIANALMEALGVLDYLQEAARLDCSVNVY